MKELVNVTICYPIGTPNRNGVIFTHDAIEKAFTDIQNKTLPIVDYTHGGYGKAIGIAKPISCILNEGNYMISNDCFMFEDKNMQKFDVEGMVNKSHKTENGVIVIEDFRIMGVSIMEENDGT